MALINCKECDNEVSDKAPFCPKCGAPIAALKETLSAGTKINTIQETSKKFKLQTLLSVSLIIIGILMVIVTSNTPDAQPSAFGPMFVITGFIWYVINRFRIWWHHK